MKTSALIRLLVCAGFLATNAAADGAMGVPPPEAVAAVSAPQDIPAPAKIANSTRETTATVSAGGLLTTGNSRTAAGTANGKFDMRRGTDGFGASLVGNYGEGAAPGQGWHVTTQNLQGRVRYDRYLADNFSIFAIVTGRDDRFQGLDFRLNLDPGVKYLFLNGEATKLWAEAGYDFQYDIRREDALGTPDANGNPQFLPDGSPLPPLLAKTATDHSSRVFVGFRRAFNKGVTFATGLEYLQSFVASTQYRLNFDALIAADLGVGLSIGLGFSARFDHAPLPGKEDLDTSTTVSLIYALSAGAPPPPPPPPCTEVPEPPPPAPSPAFAPSSVPPAARPPVTAEIASDPQPYLQ
ncbi:MAG: DUF481 domain-containing protein [Polyangiaceae bacterium]|jgi:putative salt-induced outer membrane protein YdiY